MRRLTLLVVAALAISASGPASAGPAPQLVLRGSRTAAAGLTLHRTTTLQVGGLDPARAMVVAGRASYAGFVLQRADGQIAVGGVVVRGFDVDGAPVPLVFGEGFESVRVPAGRYRITLLTDGPAQVTIPAPGLSRSVVVTPSAAASASGVVLRSPLPGAVPVSDLRVPVQVGPSSTTVLASFQRFTVSAANRYDVCLAASGTTCATGSVAGGSGVLVTPGAGESTSVTGLFFYPGEVPAATYDAVFSTVGVGVGDQLAGFALRIG